jgi:hypothetical protein
VIDNQYLQVIVEMPAKMYHTSYGKTYSKFHMPFEDFFNKRDVPFIVNLECKKHTGCSRQNECKSEYQIPDFPVKRK